MLPLILCIIFMCFGAVSLTLFIIEKIKKYSVKETLIKTITSCFFVAVSAVSLYAKGQHFLTVFVTLGLFVGLLGDIFLDLKYVFKEHDKEFTYAGFIAFAIGHAFYISGMYLEFFKEQNVLYIIIPLVVGTLISVINLLIEKLMKLNYGSLKVIVFIYGILLFSMTACSLSLCIMTAFKNVTLIMMFVGGLLFTISDLILSGTYFGVGKERPIDISTNAVSYYLAQYVIAFSVFFL